VLERSAKYSEQTFWFLYKMNLVQLACLVHLGLTGYNQASLGLVYLLCYAKLS